MTEEELNGLGAALDDFLQPYLFCCGYTQTFAHLHTYCRGLLSDLKRKSVEPIAIAAGCAVRTLQEFLRDHLWQYGQLRDQLQGAVAVELATLPDDDLGNVGLVDETSAVKSGTKTPGVQRQYLGCVGKIDNGIVTVHLGVCKGRYKTLIDAELFLPREWANDRERCKQAGIPDDMVYRPKTTIALEELDRAKANKVQLDWLTFDEGYGSKVPFLTLLSLTGQKFVAEVPVAFAVRVAGIERSVRADEVLPVENAQEGRRHRIRQETCGDAWWRAASLMVRVRDRDYRLVVAINEATAVVKYFVTNATGEPLGRVLQVAFRRATVEHGFRVAKTEAGLTHYEGRQYAGMLRHLILALIVLGFVSIHTDRLRGGKSPGDEGAGMPSAERTLRGAVPSAAWDGGDPSQRRGDPLSPAPQRASGPVPQETAA